MPMNRRPTRPAISFLGTPLNPYDARAFFQGISRVTYSTQETAKLCGMTSQQLAEQVREGTFPIRPFSSMNGDRFPKEAIHQLLGNEPELPAE